MTYSALQAPVQHLDVTLFILQWFNQKEIKKGFVKIENLYYYYNYIKNVLKFLIENHELIITGRECFMNHPNHHGRPIEMYHKILVLLRKVEDVPPAQILRAGKKYPIKICLSDIRKLVQNSSLCCSFEECVKDILCQSKINFSVIMKNEFRNILQIIVNHEELFLLQRIKKYEFLNGRCDYQTNTVLKRSSVDITVKHLMSDHLQSLEYAVYNNNDAYFVKNSAILSANRLCRREFTTAQLRRPSYIGCILDPANYKHLLDGKLYSALRLVQKKISNFMRQKNSNRLIHMDFAIRILTAVLYNLHNECNPTSGNRKNVKNILVAVNKVVLTFTPYELLSYFNQLFTPFGYLYIILKRLEQREKFKKFSKLHNTSNIIMKNLVVLYKHFQYGQCNRKCDLDRAYMISIFKNDFLYKTYIMQYGVSKIPNLVYVNNLHAWKSRLEAAPTVEELLKSSPSQKCPGCFAKLDRTNIAIIGNCGHICCEACFKSWNENTPQNEM